MAALPTALPEPHPIHRMVDAVAQRAAVTVDPRLRTLLFRAGCALLDHALRDVCNRTRDRHTVGLSDPSHAPSTSGQL